jgi:hypothetical protein
MNTALAGPACRPAPANGAAPASPSSPPGHNHRHRQRRRHTQHWVTARLADGVLAGFVNGPGTAATTDTRRVAA